MIHFKISILSISIYALLLVQLSNSFNCSKPACQEHLEMLRIEEIKKNILSELGMTKPPRLEGVQMPSKAMREHYQKLIRDQEEMEHSGDDGKNRVTTFVQAEDPSEGGDKTKLVAKFDVTERFTSTQLIEAKLSVFLKFPTVRTFGVIELQVYEKNFDGTTGKMVVSQNLWIDKDQRISISLPIDDVTRWFTTDPIEGLFVAAQHQGVNIAIHPQQTDKDHENMMLQLTTSTPSRRRRDSSPICLRGSSHTGCCLYDLIVDFDQIGWEWIIAPPAYNAYICQGHCTVNKHYYDELDNGHSKIMKATMRLGHKHDKILNSLGTCCHPSEYAGMNFVYLNPEGRVVVSFLTGMAAKKCSCS